MSLSVADDLDLDKIPSAVSAASPLLPDEPSPGTLSGAPSDIVAKLHVELDTTVFRLLMTARSVREFRELRSELFSRFVLLASAASNIVRTELRGSDIAQQIGEAFARMNGIFDNNSNELVLVTDPQAREEVLFSVNALHRALALSSELSEQPVIEAMRLQDAKLCSEFNVRIWWALMHLRCLLYGEFNRLVPSSDVVRELLEGLRMSIMAYACAREAFDLRHSPEPIDLSVLPADDGESEYLAKLADREYAFVWRQSIH